MDQPPLGFLLPPSGQLGGNGVDKGYSRRGIRGYYRVADTGQCHSEPFALSADIFLRSPALGDFLQKFGVCPGKVGRTFVDQRFELCAVFSKLFLNVLLFGQIGDNRADALKILKAHAIERNVHRQKCSIISRYEKLAFGPPTTAAFPDKLHHSRAVFGSSIRVQFSADDFLNRKPQHFPQGPIAVINRVVG